MNDLVNVAEEIAFLLENDPEQIHLQAPQRIIEVIDPTKARRNNFLPKGMTFADAWMMRHGDPLKAVEAAHALGILVEPQAHFVIEVLLTASTVSMTGPSKNGSLISVRAEAPTMAAAWTIAVLKYKLGRDWQEGRTA